MDGLDALSAALRAVSFTLLLNAAGIPVFIGMFGRLVPNTLPAARRAGWKLALGALVCVLADQALEAARMAGEAGGIVDPAMQRMALLSPTGAAFGVRVLGLVLLAVGLRQPGELAPHEAAPMPHEAAPVPHHADSVPHHADSVPPETGVPLNLQLALLGSLLVITSFALVGHTTTAHPRAAAAALITLHLAVVAFWLGALLPLYVVASREQPVVTARLIDVFSRTATWVVPLILVAGIGLSVLLLPSLDVLTQPYGRLLLAKVSGFAILMALASLNKWSFGPACAEGETAAFKRTVLIEYLLISMVLTATAVMTTFYSPEAA